LAAREEKIVEILCSKLYEEQLKEILEPLIQEDVALAKKVKMYLDTLIINIHTKAKKYKNSIFFDDVNIKDLEFENYTVTFCIEDNGSLYVLLGIVKKSRK